MIKIHRGPAVLLIIVGSGYFAFHIWDDGYRAGAAGTIASYTLRLWITCWVVSIATKDGAFVRWVLTAAAIVVVPASAAGVWMASSLGRSLLNLALLVGAPAVVFAYSLAFPIRR